MPTLEDVRALALSFPETIEQIDGHRGGASWRTKDGLFVWERGPSKADLTALADLGRTWPDGQVVGIRTDGLDGKEALLATFPDAFFTIPHFDGYPAVLARLSAIDPELLREVITDAWILKAPKRVSKAWIADHG
jgi:hypothetical protein